MLLLLYVRGLTLDLADDPSVVDLAVSTSSPSPVPHQLLKPTPRTPSLCQLDGQTKDATPTLLELVLFPATSQVQRVV